MSHDHTPLPWNQMAGRERIITTPRTEWPNQYDQYVIAECDRPENSRRILACVRVLRDVSTEALEELVHEGRELEVALTLATVMDRKVERSEG